MAGGTSVRVRDVSGEMCQGEGVGEGVGVGTQLVVLVWC